MPVVTKYGCIEEGCCVEEQRLVPNEGLELMSSGASTKTLSRSANANKWQTLFIACLCIGTIALPIAEVNCKQHNSMTILFCTVQVCCSACYCACCVRFIFSPIQTLDFVEKMETYGMWFNFFQLLTSIIMLYILAELADNPEEFRSEKYGSTGLGSTVNIKVFAQLMIVVTCVEIASIVAALALTESYRSYCSTMIVKLVDFVFVSMQLSQIVLLLTIMVVCISFRMSNIAVDIVLILLLVCVSLAQLHHVQVECLTLLYAVVCCIFVVRYCLQMVELVDCANLKLCKMKF